MTKILKTQITLTVLHHADQLPSAMPADEIVRQVADGNVIASWQVSNPTLVSEQALEGEIKAADSALFQSFRKSGPVQPADARRPERIAIPAEGFSSEFHPEELLYVGPHSMRRDSWIFTGPYGVPFQLSLSAAGDYAVATLSFIGMRLIANRNGTLALMTTRNQSGISVQIANPDALPLEGKARDEAILKRIGSRPALNAAR